jgi:hypothetical protein
VRYQIDSLDAVLDPHRAAAVDQAHNPWHARPQESIHTWTFLKSHLLQVQPGMQHGQINVAAGHQTK